MSANRVNGWYLATFLPNADQAGPSFPPSSPRTELYGRDSARRLSRATTTCLIKCETLMLNLPVKTDERREGGRGRPIRCRTSCRAPPPNLPRASRPSLVPFQHEPHRCERKNGLRQLELLSSSDRATGAEDKGARGKSGMKERRRTKRGTREGWKAGGRFLLCRSLRLRCVEQLPREQLPRFPPTLPSPCEKRGDDRAAAAAQPMRERSILRIHVGD